MPSRRLSLRAIPALRALLLVAAVALSADRSRGAEPVGPPGAAPVGSPAVREAAPEIYYMQDDAGRLVPVPGFRYRDFVDLLRMQEGLPGLPEPPPAVLENVVLRATLPAASAADQPADAAAQPGTCPVVVELTVRQARSGWVSLPLSLDGLLLTAAPRYEGPGRMLLSAGPGNPADDATNDEAGYRLWMTGPTDGKNDDLRHSVILTGNIAIDASPTHESITLHMPRATASIVELKTPRNAPDVSVRPAMQPPRIDPQTGGSGSVVTFVGLAGTARIRIGVGRQGTPDEAAGTDAGRAAVPQAMVESLVRIDGRVAITEAGIRLENLPPNVATIRVALPQRATLRSIRSPSALVALEGADTQPEAVIRIDRNADGGGVVELEVERPVDPTGREAFEPLGFAVADIPSWRQWGRTSIVVEGDWQVEWDDAGPNRRIDPPLSARRPGFVAAFAYDAQPARLPLRVLPRRSRVVIEPEYRYDVSATRVALDARLRVSARGAPVSRIIVALDDWDVDEVGPANVVDSAAVSAEAGRLVIPFVQPLSGDAIVEIRGGRQVARDSTQVGWKIPTPQADLVGPASIIIAAQSDIELLPDAAGVRGLVRQLTPTTLRSDADRMALAYRLDGTEGSFEATRRFLPRRVDAAVTVQADIDESDMIVRETIRFDVAHVPLEFVVLDMPEAVAQAGTLEVRQNGLLLNPEEEADGIRSAGQETEPSPAAAPAPSSAAGLPAPARVRLRAILAMPLLGTGEVTVQYELPTPAIGPESTVAEDLPLVLPAATRIGGQSITLTVPETLSIDVRGDAWKRDVASLGSVASRTWTTARSHEMVPLAISTRKRSPLGDTVVDAAWLQTRLLGEQREDIYRYSIISSAEQITLSLPQSMAATAADGARAEEDAFVEDTATEVRLNGRPQPGAARADGRIVVELPQRAGSQAWLLEVIASRKRDGWTDMVGGAAGMPTALALDAPVFPRGTLQRRFYWELLLEPDEHPIGAPVGWTSQQRWEWGALGLRRVPVVSRDVLSSWLLASCSPSQQQPAATGGFADTRSTPVAELPVDVPTAGTRLVFSGVGPPAKGRIWVVPTWLLVLAVSGPVLALGLSAVYLPRLRSVPVVIGVAAVASLAAAFFPELAPLVAQAAVPGAVLTALAVALRFVLRRRTTAVPARGQAPVVSASSLTQVAPQPSLIIAASSPSLREGATAVGRTPP
jgi:hypothetical protein